MDLRIEIDGDETFLVLPGDFMARHRLKAGDRVTLKNDDSLFTPSPEEISAFEEELEAARFCMKKYRTALSALAKS